MSEFEFLGPAIAVVALFAVVALTVQVVRLGRQVRRLSDRLDASHGDAREMSLARLREIGAKVEAQAAPARRSARLAMVGVLGVVLAALLAGGAFFFLRDDGDAAPGTRTEGAQPPPAAPPASTPDPAATVPTAPPPLGDKSAFVVLVLNASGVDGAAREKVAPLVASFGYQVPTAQNATVSDLEESVVMFAPGQRALALNVAADLQIDDVTPQDGEDLRGADAAVLVGRDLATRP